MVIPVYNINEDKIEEISEMFPNPPPPPPPPAKNNNWELSSQDHSDEQAQNIKVVLSNDNYGHFILVSRGRKYKIWM